MKKKKISLIVFDMEGTLTANPTVWELMHLKIGTWKSHGLRYWEQFKAGLLDYDEFARMDVATWKGASSHLLDEAVQEVPLMTGCRELFEFLSHRGLATAIVSNGLERLGLRLQREFSVTQVLANREVVRDGHLTGEIEIRVPYADKARALLRVASDMGLPQAEVMAVGDGPADVSMFRHAGYSIAFLPQNDPVKAAARAAVHEPDLRCLIPLIEETG